MAKHRRRYFDAPEETPSRHPSGPDEGQAGEEGSAGGDPRGPGDSNGFQRGRRMIEVRATAIATAAIPTVLRML